MVCCYIEVGSIEVDGSYLCIACVKKVKLFMWKLHLQTPDMVAFCIKKKVNSNYFKIR